MRETLDAFENLLYTDKRSDALVELAAIIERYIDEHGEALADHSRELQELPSLLHQLGTAVDTSVTDEL